MWLVTCTLGSARLTSAPFWTSRSTTSVWPFWLATYTGLRPSCDNTIVCITNKYVFTFYVTGIVLVDALGRDFMSEISRELSVNLAFVTNTK